MNADLANVSLITIVNISLETRVKVRHNIGNVNLETLRLRITPEFFQKAHVVKHGINDHKREITIVNVLFKTLHKTFSITIL